MGEQPMAIAQTSKLRSMIFCDADMLAGMMEWVLLLRKLVLTFGSWSLIQLGSAETRSMF